MWMDDWWHPHEPMGLMKQLLIGAAGVLLCAAIILFAIGAIAVAIIGMSSLAPAQPQNHEQHHAQYQNWFSNGGYGCCNENDCGTLDASRVRENGDRVEVLVLDDRGDQWCPVEFKHLVNQKNGKRPSPDWTMDHACIIGQDFAASPCERLKCFMEKGKF